MKDKASILLGIDTKVLYGGGWVLSDGAKMEIGERGRFAKGRLLADENAHIKIGNDFSINATYHIEANADTSIVIGNDCMASYDVVIQSNDSHSIFNLDTGENTNSTRELNRLRKVIIGDHVWIGIRAIVLYNSEIGSGSIIGAASLVKSKIPNNCIAAGVPAKIKKEHVAWGRENGAGFIKEEWDYRDNAMKGKNLY